VWFFQAADGSVLALLAVDAPHSLGAGEAQAAVWIVGAAEGASGGSLQVAMTPAEDGGAEAGWQRFTGRAYLEPGDYDFRFAVGEGQGTLRVHGERAGVPELGTGGLSASSVVAAERFGPAPSDGGSVFAVGSEEVVPRPGATFKRSEPLRLYFQLYGAEPDAATLRPRVDLRVRFTTVGKRQRRVGDPLVSGAPADPGTLPPGGQLARRRVPGADRPARPGLGPPGHHHGEISHSGLTARARIPAPCACTTRGPAAW
jgi:hypothetical protein